MKSRSNLFCALLLGSLLSLPAFAQPGPGTNPWDCSKAPDPERCMAKQKAFEACKDKPREARRACMKNQLPPQDCSQSKNPERCMAKQKAFEACKDKPREERRACMKSVSLN